MARLSGRARPDRERVLRPARQLCPGCGGPMRLRYENRRTLVLPTGVEKVALDFNKPTQRWLDRLTVAEAKRYYAADQFDRGSMGPKIAALIDFVGGGGQLGLITNPPNLARALAGETGTRIVASQPN